MKVFLLNINAGLMHLIKIKNVELLNLSLFFLFLYFCGMSLIVSKLIYLLINSRVQRTINSVLHKRVDSDVVVI